MPANPDLLAEAFAAPPALTARCPMGRLLDEASPTARTRVQAALDLEHVSTTWIISQLQRAGAKIGKDSVWKHRSGSCRCAG